MGLINMYSFNNSINGFIKNLYKRNEILKKTFLFSFFLLRFLNLIISIFINGAKSLINRVIKKKNIKIAFIGPVHSSHFKNFKMTLDKFFYKNDKKSFMYINSYTTESTKNFSQEIIIDQGIYGFFGYFLNQKRFKRWTKDLFLKAENNLNLLNKKIILYSLRNFNPDYIWIHDLQSGGYLADSLTEDLKRSFPKSKIVGSVWGNDLYFYYEHKLHRKKLESILKSLDFLHGECPRDGKIAKSLGFNGKILPCCSVTMTNINDLENLNKSDESQDKDIFLTVKGSYYLRSNLTYLFDEINENIDFWKEKRVVFIGTSEEDNFRIEKINSHHGIKFEYFSWMPFDDYVGFLGRSKYHLICNYSDGILNSAAESVFQECLPIFSRGTGLCEFLNEELISNVTYDFKNVSFIALLTNLEDSPERHEKYLNDIRDAYICRVYNKNTYRDIFKSLEQ